MYVGNDQINVSTFSDENIYFFQLRNHRIFAISGSF